MEHIKLYKKQYIYLLIMIFILTIFQILKNNLYIMNFIVDYITTPYKTFFAKISSKFSFSLAELICILFFIFIIIFILFNIFKVIKNKKFNNFILVLLCIALTVYNGFCVFWGANYYTEPFENKIGLQIRKISVDELYKTTLYFANKLNEVSKNIQRDENNLFSANRDEIFEKSIDIYNNIEKDYPFLKFEHLKPKKVYISKIMSLMNFTGFFFPFTGEANLNIDSPICFLPSTIAHELAHQRNIAPEQTANFVAVLACEKSKDSEYMYSGYLLGYIHLANALYSVDKDKWQEINSIISSEIKADINNNNEYWNKYEGSISKVADSTYSKFLKSYNQDLGLKSYGAVVDLLVIYYLQYI